MVGLHQSVKRRFGIWFRPERWALVSFLYLIDSSKPDAFSQNKPNRSVSRSDVTRTEDPTFPCWEIGSLKEGMFQDTLNTTQCSDNVDAIIV